MVSSCSCVSVGGGRFIPCLIKKSSVLIRNSLKLSTPMTVAIKPTSTPTPEQLAAVPSKRARPAKARSEARWRIKGERRWRLMRNNVKVKEEVENNNTFKDFGTRKNK